MWRVRSYQNTTKMGVCYFLALAEIRRSAERIIDSVLSYHKGDRTFTDPGDGYLRMG